MEVPIKRVIFIENPHIATINADDFDPKLHEAIDWQADPRAARAFLEANGATAEALANVPAVVDDPEPPKAPAKKARA